MPIYGEVGFAGFITGPTIIKYGKFAISINQRAKYSFFGNLFEMFFRKRYLDGYLMKKTLI